MKSFLVQLLAAIAYEMLRFASKFASEPDTANYGSGPAGERERILALIRERMRKNAGDTGASNQ